MELILSCISWVSLWKFLNYAIVANVIGGLVVGLIILLASNRFQKRLTQVQIQNDVFVRFGSHGQEMWRLASLASSLRENPEMAAEYRDVRIQMITLESHLRALRLPILLHFDDPDEKIASRLKKIGDIYWDLRQSLISQDFDQNQYELMQDEFHHEYARLYADLALRIEKGKRASKEEIDNAAKIVMTK